MGAAPNVRLTLSSRAENVLLVRQALSGLAEAVGLDAVALNDLSTAVTEAANNVVLHAYGEGEGPLEVELTSSSSGLDALVADRGRGIGPRPDAEAISDGIGLPVIQALSDRVEFRERPGGGSEVAMHFALEQARPLDGLARLEPSGPSGPGPQAILLALAPAEAARTVLPRVLSTLAVRAHFTTDRITDLQLLADALVAELGTDGGGLLLELGVAPRNLELQVDRLPEGRARALLERSGPDGFGSLIARLSDEQTIRGSGPLQSLRLRVAQA